MDRRHFLSGSLALVAAAGLPKAIRKNKKEEEISTTYKTVLLANTPKQHLYELTIYHQAVTAFGSAADIDKIITLRVKYFETSDTTKATRSAEFKYKMKMVSPKDGSYIIETKLDQKPIGDFKFGKEFPKDLKFNARLYEFVAILGKKDEVLVKVPYPTSSSSGDDDMGCFLTTACVHHKHLADDCMELTTLRGLRDNFIMSTKSGKELVINYKQIGPSLVRSINDCENKAEIYEYMYQHLVIPTVQMVKSGRKQEAVNYYEDFVRELTGKYS